MHIQVSFKHMTPSLSLRKHIQEKCERLARYFPVELNLHWTLEIDNHDRIAQCRLTGSHMDYFGEARSEDFTGSIDEALDRVETQIRRRKERVKDHLHRGGGTPDRAA